MSIELQYLIFTIFLLLLQLVLQAAVGFLTRGTRGIIVGSRDSDIISESLMGRFERAFYNMLETFPVFASLVLIIQVTESWTPESALAVQIYFWGRVLYLPAYVIAIPYLRTLIWLAATAGIVLLAWPLLQQVT